MTDFGFSLVAMVTDQVLTSVIFSGDLLLIYARAKVSKCRLVH